MTRSHAKTVEEYLEDLPDERRETVAAVRETVLANLPEGYEEAMSYGMIGYGIPLADYPDTYNGQPLSCLALAAQKNHYALYLMCVYGDAEREARLREAFEREGKTMDMGKSCLRFKRLEDLPLEAIGEMIASFPPEKLIEKYEASRRS